MLDTIGPSSRNKMDGINLMIQKCRSLLNLHLSRNALVVISKVTSGEEWGQVRMPMCLSMKSN
jgi:hypothetical protein